MHKYWAAISRWIFSVASFSDTYVFVDKKEGKWEKTGGLF
jgi:hypothetical protein